MVVKPDLGDRVVLCPCSREHVPSVTAIYRDAVLNGTATFEIDPPDEEEMEKRRADIMVSNRPFVIATVAGDVAGYAYASAYRSRPAYGATVEDSVYIREDFRGRGVGNTLLRRVVHEASTRGYRQMIAVIGDSANLASIKLHERLGFQHTGTFRAVGFKHGRWLDTVLMQRSLGSGADTPWP